MVLCHLHQTLSMTSKCQGWTYHSKRAGSKQGMVLFVLDRPSIF